MVDIIGYLAAIATILSFTFKELRVVSTTACVLWIIYGIYKQDMPIIAVNTVVILIHSFYFLKRKS
jgi:uncharacterized protein with PQ loop repeat